MTRLLIAAVLITLLAYGLLEARPLIVGPTLTLSSPTEGATYPDGIVPISGRAARAAVLTLDGSPILPDQEGHFETTLAFPHGSSILTFTATDRFGRRISISRSIYVPTASSTNNH